MIRSRARLTRCLAVASGLAGVWGCEPATEVATPTAKPAPPATVSAPGKEADVNSIVLTPEAETRLGIATVAVENKAVPRAVSYGGEVMIPTGRLISVTSPYLGMLKPPEGGPVPQPGVPVKAGQPIFVLIPMLSPGERATMAPLLIEAENQVKQASEQLKIAQINLDRAENLVRDRLGGNAALVDAKAQYDLARTTLEASRRRKETIDKVAADTESGSMSTQVIESPVAGTIQNIHAQVGQKVAAGAILFDVAGLDPVWVKVPVYVGDLERLATDREAGVGGVSAAPGVNVRRAKPVPAPPSGDPLAATVHLYFEVENRDGSLRPGQRVGVTLPLKGDEKGLTIPRSALVRDIHGGSWVYENVGPHAFARRRVFVDRIVGDLAALTSGPKPGTKVVTAGAAELFGTEFGGSK
jgi:cobalt-zinc-cadmium efflux system membrane fusion protein